MALLDRFLPQQSTTGIQPMVQPRTPLTAAQKGGGAIAIIATILVGLYAREGGYVNNKADRGGETNYGVTIGVAREEGYTGSMREFPKHCDAAHPICADSIYTKRYIDKPGYRPMAAIEPAILDELVDSAVLHGPARASTWFQQALNQWCGGRLVVDSRVGPATIGAYRICQGSLGKVAACKVMLNGMDAKQADFFRAIAARDSSQRVFLNGWLKRRINNVDRDKCGKGVT